MAFNSNIKGYMTFGKSFSRGSAFPLEAYEIWTDLEALKAYAANTDPNKDPSYIGQKVAYIDTENNKVVHYGIEIDGSLKELGADKMGVEALTAADEGKVPQAWKVIDTPASGEEGAEDYQPEVSHVEIRWVSPEQFTANIGIEVQNKTLDTGDASDEPIVIPVLRVNGKEVPIVSGNNVIVRKSSLSGPESAEWNGDPALEINAVDTKYHLEYNSDTKQIKLVIGESTKPDGSDMVIDATDFVADGVLESVELVDADAEGAAGKFLKFTWNDEGKDVIYIPLNDFIDAYTGGETATVKVAVDDKNEITADVKISAVEGNSLVAKEDGLYVNAPEMPEIPGLVITEAQAQTPATENIVPVIAALTKGEGDDHTIVPHTIEVATKAGIDGILATIGTADDAETDTLYGLINSKVDTVTAIGANKDGIRFISQTEINKLAALNLEGNEITISGSVNASQVKELDPRIVDIVTGTGTYVISEAVGEEGEEGYVPAVLGNKLQVERGAQVNKIEQIALPGAVLTPVDKQINIPAATLDIYGVIKGGNPETPNVVSITDGVGKVAKVSTDSLVNGDDEFILYGGNAESVGKAN